MWAQVQACAGPHPARLECVAYSAAAHPQHVSSISRHGRAWEGRDVGGKEGPRQERGMAWEGGGVAGGVSGVRVGSTR